MTHNGKVGKSEDVDDGLGEGRDERAGASLEELARDDRAEVNVVDQAFNLRNGR